MHCIVNIFILHKDATDTRGLVAYIPILYMLPNNLVAMCSPPAGAKLLQNCHTFAHCSIYQTTTNASKKLHMVWESARTYTLIRDLHQYNTEQSRQFAAYIAAVKEAAATELVKWAGIMDGRFTYNSADYCVRGMYIYPIACLDLQLNELAYRIINSGRDTPDTKVSVAEKIAAVMLYCNDVNKITSLQDVLTILSKTYSAGSSKMYTLSDDNDIRYVIRLPSRNTIDTSDATWFVSVGLNTTSVSEMQTTEASWSSNPMNQHIKALTYSSSVTAAEHIIKDTRSAGIYNTSNVLKQYDQHNQDAFGKNIPLSEINGICLPIACLQMIYHMPDIIECVKYHSTLTSSLNTTADALKVFSAHVVDMKAGCSEDIVLSKYGKVYEMLTLCRYASISKNTHGDSQTKQYDIPDRYWVVDTILRNVCTYIPEIAMCIGSEHMWNPTNANILFSCMTIIKKCDNMRTSITEKCKNAPTHQPYIIVWVAPKKTVTYLTDIPVCVENTITNTYFRLTGGIVAAKRHTYYADYANRVVYDNARSNIKPTAMTRRLSDGLTDTLAGNPESYHNILNHSYALLYVRDCIK